MTQSLEAKKQILASKIALKRSKNNEERLQAELSKFFRKLKKEVLDALEEYWSEYQMMRGHIDLICSPIHEAHREYYEIIEKYKKREYDLGVREAKRLVQKANKRNRHAHKAEIQTIPISGIVKKDALFATLPIAEERMLNKTFTASERTLARVDSQINSIITDGYRSGQGINSIANNLTRRFDQLETWESKRIARTEVHGSHNQGVMDTYQDLGVEYTQWIAADDDRTRESHLDIDGEIIAIGDTYSNGLKFPGDTSGDIEEWINCRCSNAPFVIPYGYLAPSFSPFREDDLVKVEAKTPSELLEPQQPVEEPTIVEPTPEQLKTNLTKQELEVVEWAKGVQSSEFVSETGKAKARQQLEELYQKALDSPVKEPVKPTVETPNPEVKPEPTVKEEPIKAKTVSETDRINRMTSQELYDSMTKADQKKYDKAKKGLETAERNIKQLGDNPILLDIKKKNLLEIRNLEQKQRDKLLNKGKKEPKKEPTIKNERTLDNIHKDISVPTEELIPKLEKWIDKRCKNVAEFGYNFDVKTGKLISEEIRGKKGHVSLRDMGEGTGTIHSHPRNGMAVPSVADLESFRCEKGEHHFMVAEHEIWYVKATDSFGIGGMGQQIDLQRAHKECQDKAYEKVASEIKEGKIKADETVIGEYLNKYTGDELIKTFNSPPWSDTLTVKRYYR